MEAFCILKMGVFIFLFRFLRLFLNLAAEWYICPSLSEIPYSMSLFPKALKFSFVLSLAAGVGAMNVSAQTRQNCKNQYPCGDCAVSDNNGNDLAGFVRTHSSVASAANARVSDNSKGEWGYMLMRTVNVPSVSSKWHTKGELSHTSFIRTALALSSVKNEMVATWWARECNLDNGPLVQVKVEDQTKVAAKTQRYEHVMNELEAKKMTLVEYVDTLNVRDFDNLVGNHIVAKKGVIDDRDFKAVINYYNDFLKKFSYIEDPIFTKTSFVTFFSGENKKYIGYFNYINEHLSGTLEVLDLQYERDKDAVVASTFSKLKGRTVYVYGDDTYGLDKTIIKYAKANDYKLRRRATNITTKFNEER